MMIATKRQEQVEARDEEESVVRSSSLPAAAPSSVDDGAPLIAQGPSATTVAKVPPTAMAEFDLLAESVLSNVSSKQRMQQNNTGDEPGASVSDQINREDDDPEVRTDCEDKGDKSSIEDCWTSGATAEEEEEGRDTVSDLPATQGVRHVHWQGSDLFEYSGEEDGCSVATSTTPYTSNVEKDKAKLKYVGSESTDEIDGRGGQGTEEMASYLVDAIVNEFALARPGDGEEIIVDSQDESSDGYSTVLGSDGCSTALSSYGTNRTELSDSKCSTVNGTDKSSRNLEDDSGQDSYSNSRLVDQVSKGEESMTLDVVSQNSSIRSFLHQVKEGYEKRGLVDMDKMMEQIQGEIQEEMQEEEEAMLGLEIEVKKPKQSKPSFLGQKLSYTSKKPRLLEQAFSRKNRHISIKKINAVMVDSIPDIGTKKVAGTKKATGTKKTKGTKGFIITTEQASVASTLTESIQYTPLKSSKVPIGHKKSTKRTPSKTTEKKNIAQRKANVESFGETDCSLNTLPESVALLFNKNKFSKKPIKSTPIRGAYVSARRIESMPLTADNYVDIEVVSLPKGGVSLGLRSVLARKFDEKKKQKLSEQQALKKQNSRKVTFANNSARRSHTNSSGLMFVRRGRRSISETIRRRENDASRIDASRVQSSSSGRVVNPVNTDKAEKEIKTGTIACFDFSELDKCLLHWGL